MRLISGMAMFALVLIPARAAVASPRLEASNASSVRQSPSDSARIAARLLLRELIEEAELVETELARTLGQPMDSASGAGNDLLHAEITKGRERLTSVLDSVVLRTEWGAEELKLLRQQYPVSPLFLRYEAKLASRDGDHAAALDLYTRLLSRRQSDPSLHAARARELELLGRVDAAIGAYSMAFELAPDDDHPFRELVRLRQLNETLPSLLAQVRRLRSLQPDLIELREHEMEVLHRLGRLKEAGELARTTNMGTP